MLLSHGDWFQIRNQIAIQQRIVRLVLCSVCGVMWQTLHVSSSTESNGIIYTRTCGNLSIEEHAFSSYPWQSLRTWVPKVLIFSFKYFKSNGWICAGCYASCSITVDRCLFFLELKVVGVKSLNADVAGYSFQKFYISSLYFIWNSPLLNITVLDVLISIFVCCVSCTLNYISCI